MAKKNPTNTPYNPPTVKPNDLGGVQSPTIDTFDEVIDVQLVNVDVQVLDSTSVGDVVALQMDATPIQVVTLVGLTIGNIAPADEAEVRRMARKVGRVIKVEKGTRTCVIQITRRH